MADHPITPIPLGADPDHPLKEYFGLTKPINPDTPTPPTQPQPSVKRIPTVRKALGLDQGQGKKIQSLTRQVTGADSSTYEYENPDQDCGVWWASLADNAGETRLEAGTDHWIQQTTGKVSIYAGFSAARWNCTRTLDVTVKILAKDTIVVGGVSYIARASIYQERRYTCSTCTLGIVAVKTMNTVEKTSAFYYRDGVETNEKLPGERTGSYKTLELVSYEVTDGAIIAHEYTDHKRVDEMFGPPNPGCSLIPYAVTCCSPLD